MTQAPNFLYIMTDQLRADWLGCTGHAVVRTPNIDALAARGTVFDEFYVAAPVCMPNRASFMTGRYPSLHGLRYNGCALPRSARSFVDVLKAGGYRTASIGKSHLQPFRDTPAKHTLDGEEAWIPSDADYSAEQPEHFTQGAYDFPVPYYGFDHVDVVTGHGDTAGGHYRQWLAAQVPDRDALLDRAQQLPHGYTCPQAFRTPVPEELYSTTYIKEQAKAYLTQQAGQGAPLFTFVSFPDPHHPFNPPGRYWDMYDPDDFEVPVSYKDHKTPPPPLEWARKQLESKGYPTARNALFMAEDRLIREAMALTAGMITMIDDAVGELVRTLKDTGQYDNTIVVFNSDHGDYLGDCNMMLKGPWPRNSITRVPFVWADPRGDSPKGARSSGLASTIDIGATILDCAGLAPYHGIQGKSLLSLMDGTGTVRDELLIEYNGSGAGMGFDQPPRVRVLQTPDWHLAVYGGVDWGELYDRRADPDMLNNLWEAPDFGDVRSGLTERLAHHLIAQMDESPRARRMV
jgi:arylsulfatase A-like enzyme